MEDDETGRLISVAFGTTSEALFSVLVAFRERNAIRTFCFLSCTFSDFLDLFISCFTEVKFMLLIMWEGQRGSLNDRRIAIEDTNTSLDSVNPASYLK